MPEFPGVIEVVEAAKLLFPLGVDRAQVNALAPESLDAAGGKDLQGEIHGYRAGMEEIQGPEIERASGQVGAAGRVRDNGKLVFPSVCHAVTLYHENRLGRLGQ